MNVNEFAWGGGWDKEICNKNLINLIQLHDSHPTEIYVKMKIPHSLLIHNLMYDYII